jgi:hypothetical protein
VNRRNPFDALGLPTDPDLTDDQIHAAWRDIAAATHPDRPDGGDLPRYTAASAAYTELSSHWGRTEAYADFIIEPLWAVTPLAPLPEVPDYSQLPPKLRLMLLPDRIWYSPRMPQVIRTLITAAFSFLTGETAPRQPGYPWLFPESGPVPRPDRPSGPGTAARR